MDSGPIQRERAELDAAYQRRARLIAKMQKQAIAAANADRPAPQTVKKLEHPRWREADGIIAVGVLKIIAATALIALLGCILVRLP